VAHEYFSTDSNYEVAAFSVEKDFLKQKTLAGLRVIPFETLEVEFSPAEYEVFVAVSYGQLNRLRARLVAEAKAKGYRLASFVSPHAFVWKNVVIGEHCFIFEDNTLQPFVRIEDNVVLWSGNHIGHHSTIRKNCFIASHVVVSGYCEIGENSFLGVNSTIANNVRIGRDNWIGPGITIAKSTEDGAMYGPQHPAASKVSTHRFFRIHE